MPTGDDQKPRPIPTIRLNRSQSASPRTRLLKPKAYSAISRAKSDESVSTIPGPSKRQTRSVAKMAQSAVDVALKKFIATTDRVSQFEANINTPGARETDVGSQYMCEVHRDQIRALWEKVEKSYESCSDLLAESDDNAAISTVLESKYSYCYSVYSRLNCRCIAQLREKIASNTTPASVNVHTPASTGCRLPPEDTEVFAGDYLRWPTFGDLFTAIYIQNSRLTP
ncbi:hypothetical protein KR074_010156, partial [Drosophila pseudoananassae]